MHSHNSQPPHQSDGSMRMFGMVRRNTRMAIAILAQGNSLELEWAASNYSEYSTDSCMHTEEVPEEVILLHELPLKVWITWTRWWHLTAKAIPLVVKKTFGVVGAYLKIVKQRTDESTARLRVDWAARGLELKLLDEIKQSAVWSQAGLLLEIIEYDRAEYRTSYFRKKEETQEPADIAMCSSLASA